MKKYLGLSLLSLAVMLLVACPEPKPDDDKDVPLTYDPIRNYIEMAGDLKLNLSMVYVKGGSFNMGATPEQGDSNAVKKNEFPVHKVTLSSYHIGRFEITQAQYRAVMGENPSFFQGDNLRRGMTSSDSLPVEYLTWDQAAEFCKKLSEKTGRKYVLPTEAQWEFAARGGTKGKGYKFSGSDSVTEVAWCLQNSGTTEADRSTHNIGLLKANELGIHDMSGNVWEWCNDWYGERYYDVSPEKDPTGPTMGTDHVAHGGGWDYQNNHRVARRGAFKVDHYQNIIGFRVVCLP